MLLKKSKIYIGDEVKFNIEIKENAKMFGDQVCKKFTFFEEQVVDNNVLLLKLKENIFVPVRDVKSILGLAVFRVCASFDKLHLFKKLRSDKYRFTDGEVVARNIRPCFEGEDKNKFIDSDYLVRYIYSHRLIEERERER